MFLQNPLNLPHIKCQSLLDHLSTRADDKFGFFFLFDSIFTSPSVLDMVFALELSKNGKTPFEYFSLFEAS